MSARDRELDFLAARAHDLRTPLQAISVYVDILSREYHGPVTTEQKEDLAQIKAAVERMAALIRDLSEFTVRARGKSSGPDSGEDTPGD